MRKIILIISNDSFNTGKDWEAFKNEVEKIFGKNPQHEVESHFHHPRLNSREILLGSIPAWPRIIIFDEIPEPTVERLHRLLSPKNKETIFYAKNRKTSIRRINGINPIQKIGVVAMHLTAIH